MIKDIVSTYIEFDNTTGALKSITSYPQSKSYIEVDPEKIKSLLDGTDKFRNYAVNFNPVSCMYELESIHEQKAFEYNIHNSLYNVPTGDDGDIILVKDYKQKKWLIEFGKIFQKTIIENNVTLNTNKQFSITKVNDPYQLYRSLQFNLAGDLSLQFDNNDATIQEFNVYTNKTFNSYSVEIRK
jgi:hypothetical protein